MGLSSEAPELPVDLVTEQILTRLPGKSLMRFKCVSRHWLSVISSKHFTDRFLTVRPSPRLFMCLWDPNDDNRNRYWVTLSLAPSSTSSSSTTTPSSFVVDQDLTIPGMGGYNLQNFRGFMCYSNGSIALIYNPATAELVTLPFFRSCIRGKKVASYYFGHDPVNDQYKVVSLVSARKQFRGLVTVTSENWVFDLKTGKGCCSWKKAALTPPDFSHQQIGLGGGVCIDGVIYYLAWTPYKKVVVSFDIRSEEFNMIPVPYDENVRNMALLEHGGKVTLFDQTNLKDMGVVALWTLEEARSKKWSCKSRVLESSQMHLVNSIAFKIRGTTQKGKVLLKPEEFLSPFHILCYDIQSNDMSKIEMEGIPNSWFSLDKGPAFDLVFMDQSESVMEWETLIHGEMIDAAAPSTGSKDQL
ncbi:unnamed protein product [Thlaspi arvense]|uniref:F-box domain-containing protein n=1 Tax=Thlaspi arvense TaxID=13288 RepID=A0AAU9REH6_THLAR|nr:unnamed protein product [Thlaspi arvense]